MRNWDVILGEWFNDGIQEAMVWSEFSESCRPDRASGKVKETRLFAGVQCLESNSTSKSRLKFLANCKSLCERKKIPVQGCCPHRDAIDSARIINDFW